MKRYLSVIPLFFMAMLASSCATTTDEDYAKLESRFVRHFKASRAIKSVEDEPPNVMEAESMPAGQESDWEKRAVAQLRDAREHKRVTVENLVDRAITHSSQIATFSHIPLIRETAIDEAKGAFETRLFAKGRYDVVDEPEGTMLQTIRTGDFEEEGWSVELGVKKKFVTGGTLSLSQKVGFLDNSSPYFAPTNQARTKASLEFTQPLLNGAGKKYNNAQVSLAEVDTAVGVDEHRRQAEAHVLEVVRSYWSLYFERIRLVLRLRLVEEARALVKDISARKGLDALASQVARAEAELAVREAETVRARSAVLNAEARIRALVGDPELGGPEVMEIVPATVPTTEWSIPRISEAMTSALDNRPEISQSIRQFQASLVRVDIAKSQLRPYLNLIMEAYLAGLAGDEDLGEAISEQNAEHLNYMVALVLEVPLTRKTAKARHRRRRLEVRQLSSKLKTTAETVLLEVEVSMREVDASYREMLGFHKSMSAASAELEVLEGRREVMAEGEMAASQYLEQLLDGQRRLATAEEKFERSRVTYNLALANLERATGTLAVRRGIAVTREEKDGLPELLLKRVVDE